jgi:hypothetical protein
MPGTLGRDEIYQLAGYLLRDYPDEFSISPGRALLVAPGRDDHLDAGQFLRLLGCASPLPVLRDQQRGVCVAPVNE